MLKIDNQKNYYIQEVEKAYQEGYRFYINGGGSGACLIYKKVFLGEGRKIPLEAFVVNDSYYDMILGKQELVMCGHPIIPIRDIDLNDERIFICMGYTHYDFYDTDIVIPNIKGKFLIGDNFFTFDRSGKEQYLDYNFFNKHKKQFEKIYNKLEDEKSKAVLQAYINQKISGKFEYLSELWNLNQYYDDEIIDISKISGIVDCGAFDGDSYKAFIDAYYARTGKEYSEYAYLWEPEIKNIEVLHKKYDNNKKINIIEKAAWNTTEQLYFSGNGTGGGVEGGGGNGIRIEADSIDNIVDIPINFIKMDIEGSEYNALIGARKTIERNNPILAICVYHKRDDLLTIPNLIQNINENYKFYLRAYSRHAKEIVLYAVV